MINNEVRKDNGCGVSLRLAHSNAVRSPAPLRRIYYGLRWWRIHTPRGTTSIVFAALIAFLSLTSLSAAPGEKEDLNSGVESLPFTILIVGTRHFSDVDVIRTNIQKMPAVHGFSQRVSSQNHIEFGGTYSGEAQNLILDIEGLAADRFEVRAKNYRDRGMVITLRKIATAQ